ncbi:MAG: PEP-CTERM sorting domain-containing protein [Armatimonadetes bacterium]|nr:PEP-CTERM sorting domain-containing protein [Armatimonadota bacterium]
MTYTSSVPEPATMTLLAIAAALKRRKAKKAQA